MASADERRNLQSELLHLKSVKIRMVEDIRAVLTAHGQCSTTLTTALKQTLED